MSDGRNSTPVTNLPNSELSLDELSKATGGSCTKGQHFQLVSLAIRKSAG